MASCRLYPEFVEALRHETGLDPQYTAEGLLFLASSAEELAVLENRYRWQREMALRAEMVSCERVHAMEPLVTMRTEGAMLIPDDAHVVPRRLVQVLAESCRRRGVEIRTGVTVNDATFDAKHVVVAAGVWSPSLSGLRPTIPVSPRKGQILSLNMPEKAFRRIVRWRHTYMVPRPTGELVIGATNEDAGFDRTVTTSAVEGLLDEARKMSSQVAEYSVRERWTGLRPATPDGLPIIGPTSSPGVLYATGHYRNGILLAPITAAIVAALIRNEEPPIRIEPFSAFRFGS
jgi:glycine oxidase